MKLFISDDEAYNVLEEHKVQVINGIIVLYANKDYPSLVKSAVKYLCEEWDHACVVEGY